MPPVGEIEASIPGGRRYAWSLLRHRHDADDLVVALGHIALRALTL
jgi:hypothetical protein